jgi:predicted ATP-grasp superfamily ATP-dependent carboligase
LSDPAQSAAAGKTVILLGTDTPIGLAVVRDLGRHGYRTIGIGRRRNAIAGASKFCHHHEVRADGEDALIAQIKDLSRRHRAGSLLAVGESDLLLLNRHRAELEADMRVLIPTHDRLMQALDKATCQRHAQAVGLVVPRTWQFSSLEEARRGASALPFPLVLKWSDPHEVSAALESAGLELVKTDYPRNADELFGILTRYSAVGRFPLVQEYCPGHGMGQMFLARDGDVILEFQHERIHEWPPEGGASTLCRSVPLTAHREIREASRRLLGRLRWTGVAMVEYRFDPRTGSYVFMEINGRFWGSLPLATAAGIPFAAGLVAHCSGEERRIELPRDYPSLTACYWIPETKRLLRMLFQRRRIRDPYFCPDPRASLWTYLSFPLRPSSRWFVFELSDPKPFLSDMLSVLGKLARRK